MRHPALCFAAWLSVAPAMASTIIDDWASVKPPPVPELKTVTPDPKTTALLVLDLVRQRCNAEMRPRCLQSIAPLQNLLENARKAGMLVVESTIAGTTGADVVPQLAPVSGEPVVTTGPDKFLGTDLEKILRDKGIKTVIVVGTAAEGAVLLTATGAALRGMEVIVPVDGMSSASLYPEQYVAWDFMNAPGVAGHVTLTTIEKTHLGG